MTIIIFWSLHNVIIHNADQPYTFTGPVIVLCLWHDY